MGPQEGDRRKAEATETDLHHEDDGAVKELATRDADDLGIRRHIGGRRCTLAGSEDELLAGGLALEDLGPLNLLSREGVLVAEDGGFTVARLGLSREDADGTVSIATLQRREHGDRGQHGNDDDGCNEHWCFLLALQLEEQAGFPWEDEVESGTSEE